MTPIFDRNLRLVAWFNGEHVFGLQQQWLAFVANGNLFSAKSLAWLGPLHKGAVLDRNGKPVAWIKGSRPNGTLKPLTPLTPLRPLTPLKPLKPLNPLQPLRPLEPLGGWSNLSWDEWLNF